MFQEVFNGRLLPGERIIWSGQPGQGLLLTSRDWFLIPFSLAWFGFTVFWEFGVTSQSEAPDFFVLWGAMFMCIGLYMVVGRFIVDAWLRRRIQYAVTDQRVLIARSSPFAKFVAVSLARLPDVQLSERAGGRGTIRFGQDVVVWGRQGFGAWSPAMDSTPQFLMIDGVRRVFDIIQETGSKP